jgi:hypothetical protein
MRQGPLGTAALALLALAGCSNNNNGGMTDGGGLLTGAVACASQATQECAKLDACRHNGVMLRYGDNATCLTRIAGNCMASLAANGTGKTPNDVAACTAAYTTATCADYSTGNINECQPKSGTLAMGAACAFSAQCQSAFCSIPLGSNCGKCAAQAQVGDACTQNSQCGRGQTCNEVTMKCQTPGVAGAACNQTNDCAYGFQCAGTVNGMNGTCVAVAESMGAACDRKVGPVCDLYAGLYCSYPPMTTAGTCATYQYVGGGLACGFFAGMGAMGSTQILCTGGGECVEPMGKTNGLCAVGAAEGTPCDTDPTKGPPCLQPGRCTWTSPNGTAGTCKLPDASTCM